MQAQRGHSSIVLTADTYTSVLTDLLAYAAEATARLVLAALARALIAMAGERLRPPGWTEISAACAGTPPSLA